VFDLFDFDIENVGCCLIGAAALLVVLALVACVFGIVLLGWAN
jgi:hypothetical protein